MAQRRHPPARRLTRSPVRRRRGFLSRFGERGVALTVLGVAAVAIGGVAVAGAITSGGADTVQTEAAASPSPAPSATGNRGPYAPTPAATHSSPARTTPSPTHVA